MISISKKMFVNLVNASVAVLSLMVLTGCDSESTGTGTLKVEIWGEEYIETGIPAEEFADDYAITYDKFLVNIKDIAVEQDGDDPQLELPDSKVWDVTKKGPTAIGEGSVDEGDYTHTTYTIAPADNKTVGGNAESDDLKLMKDNGYSVYVKGSATDGTTTKTFEWGFKAGAIYNPCHSNGVVEKDGEGTIQITIHGDHLFYNSAQSTDPDLKFTELANADTNDDGEVTEEELAAYDITALSEYEVGNMDIDNMWDYLSYMVTTVGHIDGENHCEMSPLN